MLGVLAHGPRAPGSRVLVIEALTFPRDHFCGCDREGRRRVQWGLVKPLQGGWTPSRFEAEKVEPARQEQELESEHVQGRDGAQTLRRAALRGFCAGTEARGAPSPGPCVKALAHLCPPGHHGILCRRRPPMESGAQAGTQSVPVSPGSAGRSHDAGELAATSPSVTSPGDLKDTWD